MRYKRSTVFMLAVLLLLIPVLMGQSCAEKEKVGFIYVVHGGQDRSDPLPMWDNAVEMFIYDPNHPVYGILWDSSMWGPCFVCSMNRIISWSCLQAMPHTSIINRP